MTASTTQTKFLIDLRPVHLAEADKTTRIPIAMVGTFWKGKQKFTISPADVKTMAQNIAKLGSGVNMDYEHASEFPEVALGQPIPSAGWINSIDAAPDADGIVWGDVQFTPRASGLIAAQEYRYISPAIAWGVRDRSSGDVQGATLTSCALTNRPMLDKMPAIRLSEAGWVTAAEDEGDKVKNKAPECVTCGEGMMCPKCDASDMKKMMASDVMTMSEVHRDDQGRVVLTSLRAGAFVPVALVMEMETQRVALSEVDAAAATGKITPAQKPHMIKVALADIVTFRELVKSMGQQVDLSERGTGTGADLTEKGELATLNSSLDTLARERMKADAALQYHDALKLVASDNPALNRRRTQLERKLSGGRDEE